MSNDQREDLHNAGMLPKLSRHADDVLQFKYDPQQDVLRIEGIVYGGEVFRQLGGMMPLGTTFRLAKREDGTITIKHVQEPSIDGRYINERGTEAGASVIISLASAAALVKATANLGEGEPPGWAIRNPELSKACSELSRAVSFFIEATDAAGQD